MTGFQDDISSIRQPIHLPDYGPGQDQRSAPEDVFQAACVLALAITSDPRWPTISVENMTPQTLISAVQSVYVFPAWEEERPSRKAMAKIVAMVIAWNSLCHAAAADIMAKLDRGAEGVSTMRGAQDNE